MDTLYATILILVVTDQKILLAADSRKTYLDKNGIQKVETIDKIYQTEDCFYAICGFHEEENSFSIHQLIHECLLQYSGMQNAISQMTQILAKAIKNYFSALKKSSAAIFNQLRKYSALSGEIFLIKCVKSIPTAYLLDYSITEGASVKVTINSWTINCKHIKENYCCFWRAIGNTSNLPTCIPEKTWATHPEICARKVIEEGIIKYPNFVSAPINMLELTPENVIWLEKSKTSPNRFKH
ncbi:MAG TPA: hypothetical protein VD794_15665 [Flavisolibacter sp.]|nr:hypothetical protein [Flavisolibacter sp.]